MLLLRLEYKYQYLLALSLKLYTDRLHSFYNLLTLLVHQTKEKTQKREKDINPAPLTLDTLQSKTEEFDPSFFPKSTDSYCYVVVFLFTSGTESEDHPAIGRPTSGRGSRQLPCSLIHHHLPCLPLWSVNRLLETSCQRVLELIVIGTSTGQSDTKPDNNCH